MLVRKRCVSFKLFLFVVVPRLVMWLRMSGLVIVFRYAICRQQCPKTKLTSLLVLMAQSKKASLVWTHEFYAQILLPHLSIFQW